MKKLIPLLIVLAFISGVVYYQEQLIDMFLGSGNSSNQGPGASSGPPSRPAFDFGPSDQTQADDQSTDTKSLTEDTTSETQDSDLNRETNPYTCYQRSAVISPLSSVGANYRG